MLFRSNGFLSGTELEQNENLETGTERKNADRNGTGTEQKKETGTNRNGTIGKYSCLFVCLFVCLSVHFFCQSVCLLSV